SNFEEEIVEEEKGFWEGFLGFFKSEEKEIYEPRIIFTYYEGANDEFIFRWDEKYNKLVVSGEIGWSDFIFIGTETIKLYGIM
ncbi:hypothetical protein JJE00_07735, partial [Candidatus Bathyarchaeota archaeon]|nr:hypothetical protein [Candidatus Bathyarchaeota archaeon]